MSHTKSAGLSIWQVAGALAAASLVAVLLEPAGRAWTWPGPGLLVVVLAALFALPWWWQRRRGSFDPFTAVTFPIWSYLAPVFVVGSALLLSGLAHQPMFPGLIPEPVVLYYRLALGYLAVGWCGLLIGFSSLLAVRAGARIARLLPSAGWSPAELPGPAMVLLVLGTACYWFAYRGGLVGYQRLGVPGRFDALVVYVTLLAQLGAFLLWLSLFARPIWAAKERILALALVLLGPAYLVVSASRAALLTYLLILAFAYRFSGRLITWRSVAWFALLAAFSLGVGTAWSTTYRQVKGNEVPLTSPPVVAPVASTGAHVQLSARRAKSLVPPLARGQDPRRGVQLPSPPIPSEAPVTPASEPRKAKQPAEPFLAEGESRDPAPRETTVSEGFGEPVSTTSVDLATRLLTETAVAATQRDFGATVAFVARNVSDRMEITSSVAVVVANYRRLREQEQQFGIAGNIWRDTWTSVIPRVAWPDKPKVADARTYSQVYFHTGETSFAITPVADLLRNFGPFWIPVGMALFGFALRMVQRGLIEDQPLQIPRAAVYTAILMSVSYEGFYGSILPVSMRVGLVAVAGMALVHAGVLMGRRFRGREGFGR